MKFFEVIFILLLLVPVALLMRYFISRLSSERPRQRRSASGTEEDKPTISGWMKKKKQRKAAKSAEENEVQESPRQPHPDYVSANYTPRSPVELKRTERIPFAEIYGQFDRQLQEENRFQAERSKLSSRQVQKTTSKSRTMPIPKPGQASMPRSSVRPHETKTVRQPAASESASGRTEGNKKKARSEMEPSKRQKRRNRERARKRERDRRNRME